LPGLNNNDTLKSDGRNAPGCSPRGFAFPSENTTLRKPGPASAAFARAPLFTAAKIAPSRPVDGKLRFRAEKTEIIQRELVGAFEEIRASDFL